MLLQASPAVTTRPSSQLIQSLASTKNKVQEVQRLRHKGFIEAAGLTALSNPDVLDKDEFDDYCDHLRVRDADTLKVLGTYRLLSPDAVGKFGRACIHPAPSDYRVTPYLPFPVHELATACKPQMPPLSNLENRCAGHYAIEASAS